VEVYSLVIEMPDQEPDTEPRAERRVSRQAYGGEERRQPARA
jgi:hypothetical protein